MMKIYFVQDNKAKRNKAGRAIIMVNPKAKRNKAGRAEPRPIFKLATRYFWNNEFFPNKSPKTTNYGA